MLHPEEDQPVNRSQKSTFKPADSGQFQIGTRTIIGFNFIKEIKDCQFWDAWDGYFSFPRLANRVHTHI